METAAASRPSSGETPPSAARARIANALPTLREALFPAPASPEEEAAYASHQRETGITNVRSIFAGCSIIALLWWPFDPVVAVTPAELLAFGEGRATVIVISGLTFWGVRRIAFLRQHPYGAAVVALSLGCTCTSFIFVRLGGTSLNCTYFPIITSFILLMVPLALRDRVLSTFALQIGRAIGLLAGYPAVLHDPSTPLYIGFDMGVTILAIIGGALAEVVRRRSFFVQQVAAKQAEELRLIRAQLESRVEAQTRDLRSLAQHLESTGERERTHLARELHDELGQELTALGYAVQVLHTRYGQEPLDVRQNIDELRTLLDRTRETTRTLVSDLRPRVLDDLGLGAAAEWLVKRTASHTGLACDAEVPEGDLPISGNVASTAYRILQESLTNVARHAGATHASVRVAVDTRGLTLIVRDDGRGFPVADGHAGFGLIGMRERARAVGGSLHVESTAGQGTTVTARLPLTEVAPAPADGSALRESPARGATGPLLPASGEQSAADNRAPERGAVGAGS